MERDFCEWQGVRGVFSTEELADEFVVNLGEFYVLEDFYCEPHWVDEHVSDTEQG